MATKEVGKVLSKATNHADAIREAADQLYFLNQELKATAAPLHDVFTAKTVLETGLPYLCTTLLLCVVKDDTTYLHQHCLKYRIYNHPAVLLL